MKQRITNQQRRRVAAAFRRMARGIEEKAAYGKTIAFYRASGQSWVERLG